MRNGLKDKIKDYEILEDSILDDIIVISFNENKPIDIQNILNLPEIKENKINQIGFLYENIDDNKLPLIENNNNISNENFWKLISMFKKNNNTKIIDLITCNINEEVIKKKINQKSVDIGLDIRYSYTLTGNNHLGDWIQESHNYNIRNDYFNDNITNWKHVLNKNTQILSNKIINNISYGKKFMLDIVSFGFMAFVFTNMSSQSKKNNKITKCNYHKLSNRD